MKQRPRRDARTGKPGDYKRGGGPPRRRRRSPDPLRPSAGPLSARDAAVLAVSKVLRAEEEKLGREFITDTLRTLRTTGRLAPAEVGLASEISLGTIRRLLTLEHVLERVARYEANRVVPRLRATLLSAAYQVIYLDGVPAFAAVNEAVEQAKRIVGGESPKMANAVLRNLTRAIASRRAPWRRLDATLVRVTGDDACAFDRAVVPEAAAGEELVHLAAAAGEMPDRARALADRVGPVEAERVMWAAWSVPPIVMQPNSLSVSAETFQKLVRADFGGAAEFDAGAAFLPPAARVAASQALLTGGAYVQDVTARAAAALVAARAEEKILDFCAAPGGKSVALAITMRDRGKITACDIDKRRLRLIAENASRLGLQSIHTHLLRETDNAATIGTFDAALVDVPCSNSGVIARRPEARFTLTPKRLASLTELQRSILARAATFVRPGGRIVYSTCSIEPEENEQVVGWFCEQFAGWRIDAGGETALPRSGERLSEHRDGGYAVRLVRQGE